MPTKCNSCGATYNRLQPDGSHYFHQCPPEEITHQVNDKKTGEMKEPEVRTPRANVRDENLKLSEDGKEYLTALEGLGITEVQEGEK